MTHLSDLSYLQRAISTAWFYGWFVVYVFRWDRFEALRLRRLARFELRSVVTLLVLISLALQLAYDVGSARLKYLEGFWVNPRTQQIQSKPAQAWSSEDMLHVEPLYYTLACCLALENSVFFLLQAFWSYISKSVTKSSFMSSFEFKVNIVTSCFVVVLFPTVQYLFRNDFVYREVVPQMIFSILTFITGILGVRTHFRLVALIKNAREISNETTMNVLRKLEYFKDMNMILTFGFFGCAVPLGITSADGLTANPVIATNKFASDFLITNLNFFEFIIWVTLTLIFYPRKTGSGSPFGSSNASNAMNNNPRSSKDARLPRFNEIKPQEDLFYRKPSDPLEYDIDNDPAWSSETPPSSSTALHQQHANPYQQHANSYQQHHRSLSSESRQATLVPLVPPMTIPAPAATASSSVPSRSTTKNSSNSSGGKPEMISSTIYYHEGLAKAQQQQQQEQANENYSRSLENGSLSDPNAFPLRTFSQSSHYSAQSQPPQQQQQKQRTYDLPHRSTSQGSVRPLAPKPNKHPSRSGAGSSLDFRPSRDYPSLVQETATWSVNENHTQIQPENNSRPFSASSKRQQQPYQQHQQMYNDAANSARAASALAQRSNSHDSDRSLIQIAYVRPLNQSGDHAPVHGNSFYAGMGQEDSPIVPKATRPFSPGHF